MALRGDYIMRYFHNVASASRRGNYIGKIISHGQTIEDPIEIKKEVARHFKTFYQFTPILRLNNLNCGIAKLLDRYAKSLELPFSEQEIFYTISNSDGSKALGLDGFNFSFLKSQWNLVRCLYKIVAKALALRLQKVIDEVVGINQFAFIKGRQLVDCAFTTNKLVDTMKENGNLPTTYLRLPLKVALHSTSLWQPIIHRSEGKLYMWKAKTLSMSGTLTLLRLVLSNGSRIKFWDEEWIDGCIFRFEFPRIYALAVKRMGKLMIMAFGIRMNGLGINGIVHEGKQWDGCQVFELMKVRVAWWMNAKWLDLNLYIDDLGIEHIPRSSNEEANELAKQGVQRTSNLLWITPELTTFNPRMTDVEHD
ncbi:Reverse transcriptase-like protein [Theobroma cacao]|uniref:Reverse transcriptase-like protein n=1 Tax=Theobroma cacao TaxID=3641 RepID=A0A061FSK1_THECC|nr:Reverse transcriptase-like protein [Theobroma cacao]